MSYGGERVLVELRRGKVSVRGGGQDALNGRGPRCVVISAERVKGGSGAGDAAAFAAQQRTIAYPRLLMAASVRTSPGTLPGATSWAYREGGTIAAGTLGDIL